ncbi:MULTISPECIES: TetR/AcrR family transcriptional regulator [Paenibacillus]|uniref:TetR/AcrR family transcriptional regulator n=1 Tax=Paenibacillus illinoisensis TaxID=59845 RepID=A0A2W0C204_9BACL|nr:MULTISPECIES: TetR/AcrR family transcriptional regulator [Paenibacillus]MBM6383791.1 TetR/AcrR family transcriptional regulator [Paenibacillus sp.]PAD32459.1 TetR family transcriptional regulator [Paenibacillus sp. 7523-1]PAF32826.1 TetR family transcriptional regulator [Paenibacillus sp. 7516]PYY26393.1 Transcriptional regulator yxaF [Paenibacillus illinoisensis]
MSEKSNAKEQIVSTAARLFFSQGYHATGLNQIIKESSTPKGSLYHYFPHGKEELAHECIQKANEHIMQKFEDTFAAHESTGDAIQRFIHDMADETEAAGFTGFLPFSFWAAVETSCISHQLRVACQGVFANWQNIITKHLMMEGVGEEKARETGLLVISLMEGALIISLTNQDKQPLLTAADYLSSVAKNARGIH